MRKRLTDSERISSRRDIYTLLKSKPRYYSRYLGIVAIANSKAVTRLFVGGRNNKTTIAVKRNRLKRIGRELFRNNKSLLPHGYDIGLIVSPNALRASCSTLEAEYRALLLKLQKVTDGKTNSHSGHNINSHNS